MICMNNLFFAQWTEMLFFLSTNVTAVISIANQQNYIGSCMCDPKRYGFPLFVLKLGDTLFQPLIPKMGKVAFLLEPHSCKHFGH